MWFNQNWFGSLFDLPRSGVSRTMARRRGRLRPRRRPARERLPVEALEDRCLLSFNPVTSLPVGAGPSAVATGDFNNDNCLDVATANAGSGTVSVLLGNGQGGFAAAVHSAAGASPTSLAVGDLNSDGKMDLAVTNSGGVSVLLGKGNGGFEAPANVAVGSDPLSVAVGDFNSDGKMDLAVSSQTEYTTSYPYYYYYYYYYSTYRQGHVNVLLGDGTGSFSAPNSYSTSGGAPSGLAVADLDGDSDLDVVTANEYGTVSVLLGNDDGTLNYSWGSSDFATGWYPRSVTIGDFTSDGIPDIATAGSTVDILPGLGDGTFQGVQRQYVDPVSIAAADFNNDGNLDVATVETWTSTLSLFLGRGDGSLSLPLDYNVGTWPASVATGDFNNDGRPDLVTANSGSDTVSVLINDGVWPPSNAPSLKIGDATITEGNIGTRNLSFTVTLSAASDRDVTVRFSTADAFWDSATAGIDYEARSGEVTIRAGETTATIVIAILGDRLVEPTESFFIRLSDAVDAFVEDGTATASIIDDEPRISINNVSKNEGNGKGTTWFTFTISLSVAYDQPVTVNYATLNGTATDGSDYLAQSGSVTFAPGETTKTISIAVKTDKQQENNETFYVDLSAASSNSLIERARGIGTIWDDDRRGWK